MIEFKRTSVHEVGGCNYCDQGKLSFGGHNLVYPYDEVFEIRGNRTRTTICADCLEELVSKNPLKMNL
jgi:hypothetical protein